MGITFQEMGRLYYFLNYAQRDVESAGQLKSILEKMSAVQLENDKNARITGFAQVIDSLRPFIAVLKEKYQANAEEIPMIAALVGATNQTLLPLVQKIKGVVAQRFTVPENVEAQLREEAIRQHPQQILDLRRREQVVQLSVQLEGEREKQSAKLCEGVIALFELATKRPNLQYHQNNGGRDLRFLNDFSRALDTIVRSFSEKRGDTPQKVGMDRFSSLIHQIDKHQEALKQLYDEDSALEPLVQHLITLKDKEEERNALYHQLREATLFQCKKSDDFSKIDQLGERDILTFVNKAADELHAHIPLAMKGGYGVVAQALAQGFNAQKDHGGGAMISGAPNDFRKGYGQYFGEGIIESPNTKIAIDPWSAVSLDNVLSEKAQQDLKEIGRQAVKTYYEDCELMTHRYTASGRIIIPTRVDDPIQQAIMTVEFLLLHKMAEAAKRFVLGMPENERVQLRPVKIKEIVLYGIQHDIFTREQLAALMLRYQLHNYEDVRHAISAAVQRERQRIEQREMTEQKGD